MTTNPPERARTYRVSGHRVWRENTELSPAQIHTLAASLAAIARSREQAALRDAYPVGAQVWRAGNPHTYTVMGYTDSPGLPPMLRLSGNVIARPDEVTRKRPRTP
ncbi:hypothetical protein [Thermobifida cellulosilytica]|uniref:Uncharacterized protein n=1 Tax=Thermobifida cellulosilytica TB100 TaxID=665004 RepID=A0A147KEZ3_THECS|nr:hypothetical protein [Thermobifida cellulosilytica]KUP95862.1 hypothetical protein AC529_15320 [Thermobifida cellulosilytica TB100]